jgi:hypothetical protein
MAVKKRGMELSINFVVMLILAIAVLMLGIVFISKLFIKADEIKLRLDQQSQSELKAILSSGKMIAVWPGQINAKRGEWNQVGIGVLNTKGVPQQFYVSGSHVRTIGPNNNDITGSTKDMIAIMTDIGTSTTKQQTKLQNIENNDKFEFVIGLKAASNAPSGQYIIGINVYDRNEIIYGSPERVYLTIK